MNPALFLDFPSSELSSIPTPNLIALAIFPLVCIGLILALSQLNSTSTSGTSLPSEPPSQNLSEENDLPKSLEANLKQSPIDDIESSRNQADSLSSSEEGESEEDEKAKMLFEERLREEANRLEMEAFLDKKKNNKEKVEKKEKEMRKFNRFNKWGVGVIVFLAIGGTAVFISQGAKENTIDLRQDSFESNEEVLIK